ncbi:DUF2478 domain-containing protein [uncultured Paracoccus sp.]|uniref:DUF2478 domain-containing protein n=1 Tax=uncultured Paracoccus sp. TaxID=189685 RepID=UPI00262A26FC|nr:DUF2478 domain-containing protein [uncultured Paracoccus sp.]
MLAYVTLPDTPGAADRLLADIAETLAADGLRLAGAVQTNLDRGADCSCDMDLTVLGDDGPPIRISQSLGNGSSGCRVDGGALAVAAGRAAVVLDRGADLVIVNKFGKIEAEGGGFRDLIAGALADGIPVLVAVAARFAGPFANFAGDLARPVAPDAALDWCRQAAALRAAA